MKYDLEMIARMWNVKEMSIGEIALSLGATRGKISGIISRNRDRFEKRKDENGFKPLETRLTPVRKPAQTANERINVFSSVKTSEKSEREPVEIVGPITKEEAEAYDAGRIPFAKDILDIRDCDCKWWVSDGPIMFCAEEVTSGSPYCAHHKVRNKGKGTISERKAANDLKRAA